MKLGGRILVVVATMDSDLQAEVACARLMVAGIPSETRGDATMHWNPFAAKMPKKYSIMVPATAAHKAKKILRVK